jgi:hypothetical protein
MEMFSYAKECHLKLYILLLIRPGMKYFFSIILANSVSNIDAAIYIKANIRYISIYRKVLLPISLPIYISSGAVTKYAIDEYLNKYIASLTKAGIAILIA